jgi:hypothetical protein
VPWARQTLREDESRVKLNSGLPQQGEELLLKGPFAMVLFLAGDVRNDRLPPRLTDAKRAVTPLPAKSVRVLVQPSRRISLEVLHPLAKGMAGERASST